MISSIVVKLDFSSRMRSKWEKSRVENGTKLPANTELTARSKKREYILLMGYRSIFRFSSSSGQVIVIIIIIISKMLSYF